MRGDIDKLRGDLAAVNAAAGVLGLLALVMLTLAGFLDLARHYGATAGALITGLVLLVLLTGPLCRRRAAAEAVRLARADLAAASSAAKSALLGSLRRGGTAGLRHNAQGMVLAALAAGVAVGISPRLRRLVLGRER